MKSKKVLFQDLAQTGLPEFGDILKCKLEHRKVSNETYGPKSFIYVTFSDHSQRRTMERQLEARGHKVCPDYWPGSAVAEIQVSYFKGWHWAE
jgi:hypothetical protein